jgi:hypothetical protein
VYIIDLSFSMILENVTTTTTTTNNNNIKAITPKIILFMSVYKQTRFVFC